MQDQVGRLVPGLGAAVAEEQPCLPETADGMPQQVADGDERRMRRRVGGRRHGPAHAVTVTVGTGAKDAPSQAGGASNATSVRR